MGRGSSGRQVSHPTPGRVPLGPGFGCRPVNTHPTLPALTRAHPRTGEPPRVPTSLSVNGSSDIGKVRQRNEDAIALDAEKGIVVVADGMGGHPGGDVASRIAAEVAVEHLGAAARGLLPDGDFVATMLAAAERAVLEAHEKIRARGALEPELDGMGTTLTAVAVDPRSGRWVVGHVGDSRAYRMRDGSLEQLTRDDTWVQQQIDSGVLKPEAALQSVRPPPDPVPGPVRRPAAAGRERRHQAG